MQQQLDSRQDAFCNLQGDLNAMEAHHKQVCNLFCFARLHHPVTAGVYLAFGECYTVPCEYRQINACKFSTAALSVFALCYFDPAACACQ